MRVKLFSCTLETYTGLFVNYITIELGDKKQKEKKKTDVDNRPRYLTETEKHIHITDKNKEKILKERQKALKRLNFLIYLFIIYLFILKIKEKKEDDRYHK